MKNALRLISAGALLAAGLPLTALAQTITINATVNSQCNIGNATVNLGALNLAVQTNGPATNISLTCNRGATVSVALNDGTNGSSGQKRMRRLATTDYINYNISVPTISGTTTSCPTLPSTEWNATNTLVAGPMFSANGGPRDLALCVSVPSGQFDVGVGAYTDVVTATLTVS
jgi:spore coat protein U-like protein